MSERDWKVIHSSKSHKWRTPLEVFEPLNRRFRFKLDAAASKENTKCADYISEDQDGLNGLPWVEHIRNPERYDAVWLNPPYGRDVGKWMQRAYEQSQQCGLIVVCLVFASTDTTWWRDWVWRAEHVKLLTGRIRFLDHEGVEQSAAPKGSAIVVFKPNYPFSKPNIELLSMQELEKAWY